MSALDDLIHRRALVMTLSDAHLGQIERALHDVAGWLGRRETSLGDVAPLLYTQGSVSLRTSITPKRLGGFDADVVCDTRERFDEVATQFLASPAAEFVPCHKL